MYTQFFRLTQAPFSISPDPRYLFMSERHREALAHLLFGVDSGGGLVLLTGDIGTGKTTICRCFLEQVPANCNVAYIFNPKLTVNELLQAICDEFHVSPENGRSASVKDYIDALNGYLLKAHAEGRNNVLIIDEAQNLSADVLEQLRLLTNLETSERKLLQIILIGQPELRAMLARPELEQLAQRVIAHYHLTALSEDETTSYIEHRLTTAGLASASPFPPSLTKRIHKLTNGVPRRINLLCDRALLGAYAQGTHTIDRRIVDEAAGELLINRLAAPAPRKQFASALLLLSGALAIGTAVWSINDRPADKAPEAQAANVNDATPELHKQTARIAPPVQADEPEAKKTVAEPPSARTGGTLRTSFGNEKDALLQLMQLWGAPVTDADPCEAAANANLHCHRSSGGLAELRQLDRPAVLVLNDNANKPYYALLTGLGDNSATLRKADASVHISQVELTRHFHGEFVILWRAPFGFSRPVTLNDKGPEVDWIAAQLAKLNDVTPPARGQPFGQRTMKHLRLFQQAQGLYVDGVAGPVTTMHLNRVAGIDEPRLSKSAAVTQTE